LVAAAFLKPD
jgi:hypothetical protein